MAATTSAAGAASRRRQVAGAGAGRGPAVGPATAMREASSGEPVLRGPSPTLDPKGHPTVRIRPLPEQELRLDVALIRQVRFTARHRYGWPDRSEEENRHRFGEQARPHEHDWRVRVEVRGPGEPATGFVVDLGTLDAALERVVGSWRGRDLAECIPEVASGAMQPSTESLARWIHERLASEIDGEARLAAVEVWESEDLGARYPA